MELEPKDLIIYKPELMRAGQKLGFSLTFLLFWATFLYFLRPLVILLGWLVGINVFMNTISEDESFWQLSIEPVLGYLAFIGVMLVLFPLWIIYNKLAFAGAKDKRSRGEHLIVKDQVAHDMNVPPGIADSLQKSKDIVYYFDSRANIIAADMDGRHVDIRDIRRQENPRSS